VSYIQKQGIRQITEVTAKFIREISVEFVKIINWPIAIVGFQSYSRRN
jgi:hypothetical protein